MPVKPKLFRGTVNDAGKVAVINAKGELECQALSGDLTVTNAGVVTLANPSKLLSTSVTLNATNIVGNSAGKLGHAAGVTLVAAPGAGLMVQVEAVIINYTYATGAYGDGGGNLSAIFSGGAAVTGTITTLSTLGAGSSKVCVLNDVSGLALVNTAVCLVASAAMTAGTGAGTANVTTLYRLVTP